MIDKKIVLGVLLVFGASVYYGTTLLKKEAPKVVMVKKSNLFPQVINVEGMVCTGCELNLEKSVKSLPGIIRVKASHKEKNVKVEFDKSQTNIDEIMKKIVKIGYKPTKSKDSN